ncbi:PREDICTED: thioredoxin-1-like [Drosophila arizonae]|uniref:Thioredoxin-1-like n=1 Tax=Drosophila arizonae TaxID=7263 RepID=A0ABM1PQT8_DROAR|nr:PREDICTED: thioredoxin-1-like [Drosophila arizonae]
MTTIRSLSGFNKRLEAAEHKLIVLEFYATWSAPCKDIDEAVKALARQNVDKAEVIQINVDKFEDLVDTYRVRRKPTFVFIKNKRNIYRVNGADEEKLKHTLFELCK